MIIYRTDDEVLPLIVRAVLNLQSNAHLALRHTSIRLLGELSEWIELHHEFHGM